MSNNTKKKIRAKYNNLDFFSWHKGRDNKDYYNSSGAPCGGGYKVRVPSLKDSDYTWKHFYTLFPEIKNGLETGQSAWGFIFKSVELVGNVYVIRQERLHGGAGFRVKTIKFKKVW